jgi:23S rRNA (cytosine1962-C5)-methyltransferase
VNSVKKIILKKGREYSVRQKHPWIFSGSIGKVDGGTQDGDIVQIHSDDGEALAVGHYAVGGSIAVKILEFSPTAIDSGFLQKRFLSALDYRKALGLPTPGKTTAFRLIHGEGDGLPGLIVDIYDSVAVIQCNSTGMIRLRDEIVTTIRRVLPNNLTNIIDRTESVTPSDATLFGSETSPIILENGLHFKVDCVHGQKTGFFLDQRDNRELIREISNGRIVLNAFCYSGGFSISALAGGAQSVVSLDSSEKALELVKVNLGENLAAGTIAAVPKHEIIRADFLRYMQDMSNAFDLVILDPPAFAKHRKALESGIKGYRSINTAALKAIQPGGLLATFSCSQLVSSEDFLRVVEDSARRANRSVRVVHRLHQAPCHPTNIFHPEGDYLKGFILFVE